MDVVFSLIIYNDQEEFTDFLISLLEPEEISYHVNPTRYREVQVTILGARARSIEQLRKEIKGWIEKINPISPHEFELKKVRLNKEEAAEIRKTFTFKQILETNRGSRKE